MRGGSCRFAGTTGRAVYACVFLACLLVGAAPEAASALPAFVEVADAAGVAVTHGYRTSWRGLGDVVAGGVAAADYDRDGWDDVFVVAGDAGGNFLFRNRGDGTFAEVPLDLPLLGGAERLCGPTFADIDGDRDLDLFVGTADFNGPLVLRNDGSAGFHEFSRAARMFPFVPFVSASFGDYDRDGDLDLLSTHWGGFSQLGVTDHLWRNDGSGIFTGITEASGIRLLAEEVGDFDNFWTFTGNFADIDGDGWPDILMASDFGLSQVFRNRGDGTFAEMARDVLTEENGMGAAIGDYDNDGDLDWFVTSIEDREPAAPGGSDQHSGNRMYRNRGDGSFEDVTDAAGVRDGAWGWAACFEDFDNDGDLDLFHVNGWDVPGVLGWAGTPARLFVNEGDGSFAETAAAAGIDDRGEGRGVACFDYDRDGDIDVLISNNNGTTRLYQNVTADAGRFVVVRLVGRAPNTEAIGARIHIEAGGTSQLRELRAGNNYVSQSPAVAHFGVGDADRITSLRVDWPDGASSVHADLTLDRHLVVPEVAGDANCDGEASAADLVVLAARNGLPVSPAPCPVTDLDLDGATDSRDGEVAAAAIFAAGSGPLSARVVP